MELSKRNFDDGRANGGITTNVEGIRREYVNSGRESKLYLWKGTAFEQYALKDINFEIQDGELVGIIITGSGKSTLIQHLNGLIKATSGKIYF